MDKKRGKALFDSIKIGIIFLLLFVSISLFYIGFHNVDLSYNFKNLASTDCNLYKCVPLEQVYMQGLAQMQMGFYVLVAALLSSLLFWRTYYLTERRSDV